MPLHLTHRPETFADFVGNGSIVKSLQSKLKSKNLPHCLMFQGPSGCGKTTLARIIRNELKCSDFDFLEINAATNRGIDTAREIIKNIRMRPMQGDVRIYLLDEVHQGSKDFQTALLKPLEDTPNYVYFILCTTDPQKLLKTVRNRCTTYEVVQLSYQQIEGLVSRVADAEGKQVDDEAIQDIAEAADGCPRQALVILDQIIDMDTRRQRRAIKSYLVGERQTIELCRALFNQANWPTIQKILRDLKEEPESVRRAVIGYMSAVAMKESSPRKVENCAAVFNAFRYNFFDNGKAGLVFACWEAICEKDINI
jgi:DNA polymerase-3 subunit gamma/tau